MFMQFLLRRANIVLVVMWPATRVLSPPTGASISSADPMPTVKIIPSIAASTREHITAHGIPRPTVP